MKLEITYFVFKCLLYLSYVITFLNVELLFPSYTSSITPIIHIFASGILLWRFNPLQNHTMTDFDKTLIFDIAFFLFTTTILTNGYLIYITKFHEKLF